MAWHSWGLANFYCIKHFDGGSQYAKDVGMEKAHNSATTAPIEAGVNTELSNVGNQTKSDGTMKVLSDLKGTSKEGPGEIDIASLQNDHALNNYLRKAIKGFLKAIQLSQRSDKAGKQPNQAIEDILRLLTLWFTYGSKPGVKELIEECVNTIPPSTWLQVLPQLIARIQLDKRAGVKISAWPMIGNLLYHLGMKYPQALVYPLTVAANSRSKNQKQRLWRY